MTKTDEFIEKIEQLDQHLKVQKYDNGRYAYGGKVDMIVWYETNDDWKLPFAIFAYYGSGPVVETDLNYFGKDDLILYSKVIKLCSDYFPFLFGED